MTKDKMNAAIALYCGWRKEPSYWIPPHNYECDCAFRECDCVPPDYVNDLNAMHEVEKKLRAERWDDFKEVYVGRYLDCLGTAYNMVHATAMEKAKAVLRTLGELEP